MKQGRCPNTSHSGIPQEERSIMAELMRANKVTVKTENGEFVATFHKTHTEVGRIHQSNAEDFKVDEGTNKALAREMFRQYAIDHAKDFNIEYDPVDRRAGFVPRAQYTDDEVLAKDALNMALPIMQGFADKMAEKYPVEWKGIDAEEITITPMTETASGKNLIALGIEDGKYKSGNWAWANIAMSMTIGYSKQEVYVPFTMQLVSGQLKKCDMTITKFTEAVKMEIIAAGLATAEELDPPKEKKSKAKKSEEKSTEEAPAEEKSEEKPAEESKAKKSEEKPASKPKRQRRSKAKKSEEKPAE
jgi:hypothetical protein